MAFMTLKNRIQHIILNHCNRSNKVFANRINIATSTIQSWDDEHFPKGDILHRIHKEFDVNINWLLTGEGAPYIKKDRKEIAPPGMIREPPAEYEERAPALGLAVNMLTTVLESDNQVFTQAVISSLIASSQAINTAKQWNPRVSNLESKLDDLRNRLAALEEKCQKDVEAEKEDNVEKTQCDLHTHLNGIK